ncbi:MAG: peptidoglycan DD-metalloendopeptidase family protein, partial [Lachnospiraceae bacterium]|nr:peptidoglycan DD-metalloendopeptidase family protein [Lachnospiraceae bacterium]
GGGLVHTAQVAAISKAHWEVREAGRDNVSVESADKVAAVAERAESRVYHSARNRLRSRPYRAVKYAENKVLLAEQNAAYQKFLTENPEIQKKALAKLAQKQKIKRQYAAAARKAKEAKGAGNTARGLASTGKTGRYTPGHRKSSKAVLLAVILAILAFAMAGSLFSAGSSMLMGTGSTVISACYLAEETEINQSELRYTEMETDLQLEIADTERNYPGYDEYRYNIGEIGHNPYELLGYLSAAFDDFTYAQVEAELDRLFGLQYELTRESVTETRTYLDEEGEEQEYEWRILKTVLSVRSLSGILSDSLASGDQAERYGIYMQTCGGRQNFGSPFDFPWLGSITSPYGYRVHPINGGKDLHRGIDIAAAEGTPILAVQDGRVASAGDAGGYGLCLVIEGEDGYQSRYAHCSSILVNAGQEVRRGDVVAYVGSTGDSTGPHLHLEAVHNGEYLNPYFFVENGGGGFTAAGNAAAGVSFSADPGEPMEDGTFQAMLEVAERYVGYPYVWGGSSPETSFDCSGYVSYVINQSGAGSVGRQTAQGLCNLCTPIPWEGLQPGDLVFFTGTYSSLTPVSHVGIYVGDGKMINAGDPIGYADIGNSRYWESHFYCGGRLP